MAESRASAVWEGNLVDGSGVVSAASGLFADAPDHLGGADVAARSRRRAPRS